MLLRILYDGDADMAAEVALMEQRERESFVYRTIGLDAKLDREIQKRAQEQGETAAVVIRYLLRKGVEAARSELALSAQSEAVV